MSSAMEQLSQSLAKDVGSLTEYLNSIGSPAPSLDRNTPTVVLPNNATEEAHATRERILDSALKVFQLAAGPSEYLANLQMGYQYISCVRWLCHFQIFHLVPLEGSISYADLAILAKVPESALKSITRMAMTNGLFVEMPPQHIAHSATSALLQTSPESHAWAVFNSNISVQTALAMLRVHKNWSSTLDSTHTEYNAAFNTDFAGYMRAVTASQGTGLEQLVKGWDWASLGKALVVDVGGSTGHASIALAQNFPDLTFIVEDLPEVADAGPSYLESRDEPRELASRISYKACSFFDPQPVNDGDVYLLRMILHDWGFDDSVKIMSRLFETLKPGARILIMDSVLPDPGSIPSSKELPLRMRDLTMLQVFNSQERDVEDWKKIFTRVDSRLTVKQIIQPAGSVMSIIELALE
ncbi:hypothetical protein N7488_010729 [Penicillium malachiteum]|nr:hypothetical protein N7488_010729 [Penicillium malachiteum]